MKTRKLRLLSFVLAVAMMFAVMPATAVSAFATDVGNSVAVQTAEDSKTTNNSCGKTTADSVTWNFDQATGTLTISGTGDMADYTSESQQPWYSNANNIEKIVINEGVKSIGAQSFRALSYVKQVTLADSVESIGDMAFRNTGLNATEALILHLGKNVSSISTNALMGNKFAAFIVDEENTSFMASADGLLYSKDGKKLISYPMRKAGTTFNNAWLDGVEVIGTRAFFGARFDGPSDIVIPETVKVVGAQAFSNTFNLNNAVFVLHLPNSLEKLEYAAFFAGHYRGVLKLGKNLTTIVTTNGSAVNGALYDGHNYKGAIDATEINPNIRGEITHVKTGCKMVVYVKDAAQKEAASNVIYSGLITNWAFTNGGSFAENTTFEEGKLATPEKAGYTFKGWYDNAELTGNAVTTPTTDKTYYAKWEAKQQYTVSFDLNGQAGTAPETQTVYEEATATKPADPTAKGYKFAGWYTDAECKNAFDFTKPVTANTTLYAKWEAIPDHQLTVTGGTFTVKDKNVETKTEGDTLMADIPEGAEVTVTFHKDAYADSNLTFDGWKIEGLVDAENYTNKEEFNFTMPKNGVTIAAQTKAAAPAEDDSLDAATVVTGVVLGTGTAILAYHIGTEVYAEQVLGKGVAIPRTREEVALKAWELAGKPAVELNGEPLSEAAQAEKWAVESGLMQNVDGSFNGSKKMSKLKALRTLDAAKKLG